MTSHNLIDLAIYSCYGSILLFFLSLAAVKSKILEKFGSYSTYCGFLLITIGYMLRCKKYYDLEYRHFLVTNLYDMAVFFSWAILLVIVLLDIRFNYRIISAFLVPFSIGGATWAQLKLDSAIESLHPIMKSYWLLPHTMTFSLSCAVQLLQLPAAFQSCTCPVTRGNVEEIMRELAVDSHHLIFRIV
jgi:ABC-type transport system involved in cytochrome c biogenesis permease subunit